MGEVGYVSEMGSSNESEMGLRLSGSWVTLGIIPRSVMMPVMREAGATSKEGFQTCRKGFGEFGE